MCVFSSSDDVSGDSSQAALTVLGAGSSQVAAMKLGG